MYADRLATKHGQMPGPTRMRNPGLKPALRRRAATRLADKNTVLFQEVLGWISHQAVWGLGFDDAPTKLLELFGSQADLCTK